MLRFLTVILIMTAAGCSSDWAQVAASSQVGGGEVAGAHAAGQPAATGADARTEKQKLLATQTDRLLAMATELKAQVDLTNKNILSLKVVQKAEEIEALAKGMRGQMKR